MPSTRRQFLGFTVAAGTIPIAAIRPLEATPAMLDMAIHNVVGEAQLRTGKVRLDIPPLVENGNTVPMIVSVASPMTATDYVKSIHVFNEKNPSRISAIFISAHGPGARRSRPASGSRTARRLSRSRDYQTIPSGKSQPMSS
jgi:sulfur-oxidizing protein SoxY